MTQFDDDDLDEREDPDESEKGFDDEPEEMPCPYCGEPVYEQAEICPHCRSYINLEDAPRTGDVSMVLGWYCSGRDRGAHLGVEGDFFVIGGLCGRRAAVHCRAMRQRMLRIAILLFVIVWFGLIVPGHRPERSYYRELTRITTAAMRQTVGVRDSNSHSLPDSNRAACAICHLIATLEMPAAVQLSVPPHGFTRLPPASASILVCSVESHAVRCTRGPPNA